MIKGSLIPLKLLKCRWYTKIPVRNLRICQKEAFLNSLPSKFSLATPIFSHTEIPLDRKCIWKELGEPYTPKKLGRMRIATCSLGVD